MSVRYYQFGKVVGGSDSGGGAAVPAEALYGSGQTAVGQVPAAGVTITFTSNTKQVTIRNRHDSNYLDYSFDGGATWLNMGPYGEINEDISVGNVMLRNGSGTLTNYEVVGILQG